MYLGALSSIGHVKDHKDFFSDLRGIWVSSLWVGLNGDLMAGVYKWSRSNNYSIEISKLSNDEKERKVL